MKVSVFTTWAAAASLILFGLLAGCHSAPPQQNQALNLLRLARCAEDTVSLQGQVETEIARRGGMVQAQANIQRSPGRTVVTFTKGPAAGKEIVRTDGKYAQVPGRGARRRLPGAAYKIPPVEALSARYDVELGEATTIAGRPVQQVTIRPREGGSRQSITLWIDTQTGFPLARERRDAFGRVIYSSRFLRVNFGAPVAGASGAVPAGSSGAAAAPSASGPAPEAFPSAHWRVPRPPSAPASAAAPPVASLPSESAPATPAPESGRTSRRFQVHPPASPGGEAARRLRPEVVSLEQLGQTLGFTVSVPAFIPERFTLVRVVLAQGGHGPHGVLRFSDRVESLIVLVGRRQDLRRPDLPASAEGAGNSVLLQRARGSIAVAIRGQAVYAVFGPVPDDTLQRIAASIP